MAQQVARCGIGDDHSGPYIDSAARLLSHELPDQCRTVIKRRKGYPAPDADPEYFVEQPHRTALTRSTTILIVSVGAMLAATIVIGMTM